MTPRVSESTGRTGSSLRARPAGRRSPGRANWQKRQLLQLMLTWPNSNPGCLDSNLCKVFAQTGYVTLATCLPWLLLLRFKIFPGHCAHLG